MEVGVDANASARVEKNGVVVESKQKFRVPTEADIVDNAWLVNLKSGRVHKVLYRYDGNRVIISADGGLADVDLSDVLTTLHLVVNVDGPEGP